MLLPQRTFYFVRHGQTDWNLEGRMQGHTDIPLNANGLEQAVLAAERLHEVRIDVVVSSPLVRALKTAAVIAETHQWPLRVDTALMERTFGSYEGKLTREMRALHGLREEESISTILPPDAEQWPATKARAAAAVDFWLRALPDQSILFVGHGAFFRALYEVLGGPRMEAANAVPYRFVPVDAGWKLEVV
ncbi:MAG: histidine phosphatase family protein [Proteobacteria bacterium]|nr:histidine phosphatase family protein [Pseudomonadota bacterium]